MKRNHSLMIQEIVFDHIPNDILKLILHLNGNEDGISFLQNRLVCKSWNKLISDLMEFNSKKTLGECYWNNDLLGIIGHIIKLKNKSEKQMYHFIVWNKLAKLLGHENILDFFYKSHEIYAYSIQDGIDIEDLKMKIKKIDRSILIKMEEKWVSDKKIEIKTNDYFWNNAFCHNLKLDEKYILDNIDDLGDQMFHKGYEKYEPILRFLHKHKLLSSEKISKWFENRDKDRNETNMIIILFDLDSSYIENLNIEIFDIHYSGIPYLYKKYKNEIDKSILDAETAYNVIYDCTHKCINIGIKCCIDMNIITNVQLKANGTKFFKKAIEEILTSHIDWDFYGYIGHDKSIGFFNRWLKLVKNFIQHSDNTDFIDDQTISIILHGKIYTLLKLIIEKRTKPISKNDVLLLNLIINNAITPQILEELIPQFNFISDREPYLKHNDKDSDESEDLPDCDDFNIY